MKVKPNLKKLNEAELFELLARHTNNYEPTATAIAVVDEIKLRGVHIRTSPIFDEVRKKLEGEKPPKYRFMQSLKTPVHGVNWGGIIATVIILACIVAVCVMSCGGAR